MKTKDGQNFYIPYPLTKTFTEITKEKLYLDSGHTWKEDEYGDIDIMAHEGGFHNGPECTKCGYNPCWHCEPIPKRCKK